MTVTLGWPSSPSPAPLPRAQHARRPFARTRRHVLMVESRVPHTTPMLFNLALALCTAGNEGNNRQRAAPSVASQSNSGNPVQYQLHPVQRALRCGGEPFVLHHLGTHESNLHARPQFGIRLRFWLSGIKQCTRPIDDCSFCFWMLRNSHKVLCAWHVFLPVFINYPSGSDFIA